MVYYLNKLMQMKETKICGGTLREIVVGGHEAFSKSEGFLGHTPRFMYPIFVGEDVKSKATKWKSKNVDMVMIEAIKEMPEEVVAENISKVIAIWDKAFCIGVPKISMFECLLSLCGHLTFDKCHILRQD